MAIVTSQRLLVLSDILLRLDEVYSTRLFGHRVYSQRASGHSYIYFFSFLFSFVRFFFLSFTSSGTPTHSSDCGQSFWHRAKSSSPGMTSRSASTQSTYKSTRNMNVRGLRSPAVTHLLEWSVT